MVRGFKVRKQNGRCQMFFTIMTLGVSLVILQFIAAYFDGWFCQSQMRSLGNRGFAIVEHGGMWADILVVSPTLAFVVSRYHLNYLSWWSLCILVAIVIFTFWSLKHYESVGKIISEAHTHHGKTTFAGWIHGFYAAPAMWVFVLFLLTPVEPTASVRGLLLVALTLTVLFPLGLIKFNREWKWESSHSWQTGIELVVVWSVTIFRIIAR